MVNSMECLDWLEDLVGRLWIPSLEAGLTQPPYRGMPLVILALDKTAAGIVCCTVLGYTCTV